MYFALAATPPYPPCVPAVAVLCRRQVEESPPAGGAAGPGAPPASRQVRLLPLQLLARDVVRLLRRHGGRLPLASFHAAFLAEFGVAARPAQFGFHSTAALLEALDDTVSLRGRGERDDTVSLRGRHGLTAGTG